MLTLSRLGRQAEWDSNGDLQLDPGLPFVASWSARLAEEAMLSPPSLEPMSPIPNHGQSGLNVGSNLVQQRWTL